MLYYHYTSFASFKSIISSKVLWLTQIVQSNDTEEVVRTLDILWSKIKSGLSNKLYNNTFGQEAISMIDQSLRFEKEESTNGDRIPYGVCLTINRDKSQHWFEYGDQGKGICFAFSDALFAGIKNELPYPNAVFDNSIGWDSVIYDNDDEMLVQKYVCLFADLLQHGSNAFDWLSILKTLKVLSGFIKNPSFDDEREIRIIYYPDNSHSVPNSAELSGYSDSPKPHYSLPWIKSNRLSALKEIIVGYNCRTDCQQIEQILKREGINGVGVTKSQCTYKVSKNR